jgi:hypothetical protein
MVYPTIYSVAPLSVPPHIEVFLRFCLFARTVNPFGSNDPRIGPPRLAFATLLGVFRVCSPANSRNLKRQSMPRLWPTTTTVIAPVTGCKRPTFPGVGAPWMIADMRLWLGSTLIRSQDRAAVLVANLDRLEPIMGEGAGVAPDRPILQFSVSEAFVGGESVGGVRAIEVCSSGPRHRCLPTGEQLKVYRDELRVAVITDRAFSRSSRSLTWFSRPSKFRPATDA